ncbi:MAG: hypothetical protein QOJ40_2783, partial [Verrucomicrobiota bacterium]
TPAGQLVKQQTPAAGTVLDKGSYSIAVSVKDAAGNVATGQVSLQVADVTTPVILSVPGPITVSVDGNCQGVVPNVLANVIASDNCTPAGQLIKQQTPAAGTVLDKGNYAIAISVKDAAGNVATGQVSLQIVDLTSPVILSIPGSITVSADGNCQGVVPNVLANVSASDNCTPASQLVKQQTPAAGTVLAKGSYIITVSVQDAAGNKTTQTIPLTIADTTAPVIQSVTANPSVLSPPNHQMVAVTVSVAASDNCDGAPASRIISVTCNEPASAAEMQITGNLTASLAATRNSASGSRIYTLTVRCIDAAGNSSTRTVAVTVPQGNGKK